MAKSTRITPRNMLCVNAPLHRVTSLNIFPETSSSARRRGDDGMAEPPDQAPPAGLPLQRDQPGGVPRWGEAQTSGSRTLRL